MTNTDKVFRSFQRASGHDTHVLGPAHEGAEDAAGAICARKPRLDQAASVINHDRLVVHLDRF